MTQFIGIFFQFVVFFAFFNLFPKRIVLLCVCFLLLVTVGGFLNVYAANIVYDTPDL